jgi:hypothetical protein
MTVSVFDIKKLSFFMHTNICYEKEQLIYNGPTNMGSENIKPEGLFLTNWKAEETTSTFDEWELRWNFNVENKTRYMAQ